MVGMAAGFALIPSPVECVGEARPLPPSPERKGRDCRRVSPPPKPPLPPSPECVGEVRLFLVHILHQLNHQLAVVCDEAQLGCHTGIVLGLQHLHVGE